MFGGDDAAKRSQGVNVVRSNGVYHCLKEIAVTLQDVFDSGYLVPSDQDIGDRHAEIRDFLRSGRFSLVVPMGEQGPVIRPLLATLTGYHGVSQGVVVVSDGSDDEALTEVGRYPVTLIHRNQVLNCLRWEQLLPILNLKARPPDKGGKGWAVLAGYLFIHFARPNDPPDWVFQSDAEIRDYQLYHCMEHLVYGILSAPSALYVKSAKYGRTNERCELARSLLFELAKSSALSAAVRRRCREMASRLTPHKWMLTGEFGLRRRVAFARPFGTGFTEETLAAMFVEDLCSNGLPRGNGVIQVDNPHPRMDGANSERKESIMQQQISNFLVRMALEAGPVDTWNLEEIVRINHEIMSDPLEMGWIPDDRGPVVAEAVENNRIIPSVSMLIENGLVDEEKMKDLVQRVHD